MIYPHTYIGLTNEELWGWGNCGGGETMGATMLSGSCDTCISLCGGLCLCCNNNNLSDKWKIKQNIY